MRKIRFRVWDKQEKRWAPIDIGSWETWQGPSMSQVTLPSQVKPTRLELQSCDRYEWQQFTGFLDKHGKEIYGGDILKLDGGTNPENISVEWNPDDAQWSCRVPWLKNEKDNLVPLCAYVGMRFCTVEILGNVYEHGDLLNGPEVSREANA